MNRLAWFWCPHCQARQYIANVRLAWAGQVQFNDRGEIYFSPESMNFVNAENVDGFCCPDCDGQMAIVGFKKSEEPA